MSCDHDFPSQGFRCLKCNREICPGCQLEWPGMSLTDSTHFVMCMEAKRKRQKTIYLCGPVSGLPENNYPAFNAAAQKLRSEDFNVLNPAEIQSEKEDQPWSYYMRLCLEMVCRADLLMVLPGWQSSRGAKLEVYVAQQLELPILSYKTRELI